MQELITSYLIQKKECNLPSLGHFRIKTKPAELDVAGKQIYPPTDEIIYTEFTDSLSGDLINYIANFRNITFDETERKISEWCNYTKEKLDSGEKIIFNSIGILQKDAVGNIFLQRQKGLNFYEPVSAERIIHKNVEHSVLVGDKETTSGVMNEFYRDEEMIEKRSWWKIWAIALLIISSLILFFYFYSHKFYETGIGDQATFSIKEPPVLHYSPE